MNQSIRDIKRNVIIPNNVNKELSEISEILGVILGDGHLICNQKYKTTIMNKLTISGSYSEDFDYYKKIIIPNFLRLFNLKFKVSLQRKDELCLCLYSKSIVYFFKKWGVKDGKKVDNNDIPECIFNSSKEIKINFLRGIFDTEGSISFKKYVDGYHSKPIISISMKDKNFIKQIRKMLKEIGLESTCYSKNYIDKRNGKTYDGVRMELTGKKKLKNFLKIIGFKNSRHTTKIEIYEKLGFCPPSLTYQQKKNILDGKLDPYSFY